jgi:tripartite-type tricarboxylate transporter receptor subunit TctC
MGGRRQQTLVILLALAGITACSCPCSCPAHAQPWPSKPIRWLVPVAAGGATDVVARLLQEPVGRYLGTTIVVENRPGGAGIIVRTYPR